MFQMDPSDCQSSSKFDLDDSNYFIFPPIRDDSEDCQLSIFKSISPWPNQQVMENQRLQFKQPRLQKKESPRQELQDIQKNNDTSEISTEVGKYQRNNDQNMFKKFNNPALKVLISQKIGELNSLITNKKSKSDYEIIIACLLVAKLKGKFQSFTEKYKEKIIGAQKKQVKKRPHKGQEFKSVKNRVYSVIDIFQKEGEQKAFLSLFGKNKKQSGRKNQRAFNLFDKLKEELESKPFRGS